MKILVLNNTSDLYGGSRIMSIVAKILSEGGHEPIVVLSENGPLVDELEKMGVEVIIIRLGILRRKYLSIPGILNRIKVTSTAWSKLNQLVKAHKIALIYSNTTGVFIGAFLAKRRKIKHIWHVHEIINKPKAFTKILGYLLGNYSDAIIVVSNAVKDHWEKHVSGKKIYRIYNGIDTTPFENADVNLRAELGLNENDLLISMIGRVNHWKGQDYFVDIAKQVLSVVPDTKFLMVGDAYPGNEHLVEHLKHRIFEENLSKSIIYIGYRTDIPEILATSDIFVLPSTLPDPFPTVILEAMGSGKPVVATMHGGALEMIVDGETGILIPFDDVTVAGSKLIELIKDPDKVKLMGAKAKNRIHEHFSLSAFRQAILNIFEQIHNP